MTTNGATPTSWFAWRWLSNRFCRARRPLEALAAALFPPRCVLCSRALATLDAVCPDCDASLPLLASPRCQQCGESLTDSSLDLCLACGTQSRAVDRVLALGPYRGEWGRLVRAFKFERELAIGRWLGERMAALWSGSDDVPAVDVITFVPMTRRDRRQRGYNQAQILAREIARRTGLPIRRLLSKSRATPLQSQLPASERKVNLRDAFRPLPFIVDQVLLVDDIYTTGSTVEECARMLKRGGARSVVVITVARA